MQSIFRPLMVISTICLLFLSLSSCTVLQWRENDKEIVSRFQKLDIPTNITYFSVDSLSLKVRIQQLTNSNSKLNLMFFHGSPSSLSAWNGYLKDATLLAKTSMYAIDRPGYGYSNFGDEMPSIEQQAQIMAALIRELGLKNVITIGSSYGGPLAARLAVLNKDVIGVMMISPAIDPQQEKKIWASNFTQWWLTRWLVPTGYRVAGDEKTVHAKELALLDKDWKQVSVPIVHIHGDIDDIVPYGNINYSREKFSNIKIVTTPNTGHEIAWARPDLILPHLLEMIEKLEKETTTNKDILSN